MRYIIFPVVILVLSASVLYADTVIMNDREEFKGLVVDEYADRITLSTVDGEKSIFREDIERIEYDTPEQNFIQLGRSYDAKAWYDKAVFYYKKAMEINPDSNEARAAYIASHTKMWRQEEKMVKEELERRNMVMDWRKDRTQKDVLPAKDKALLLKNTIGISLIEKDGIYTIDGVRPYSSAAKAGIQKGDVLAGIWGKLIRYSKMDDVIDELLGPEYSEVKVLVDRDISMPIDNSPKDLYKEMGVLLGFEYEGLVVKDVVTGEKGDLAGLKKDDFIIAIDKKITRYLSLDSIIALINSSKNNANIIFTIRRNINLRRDKGIL